ncbi:MAG: hypothetical protein ACRDRT_16585, partial [Pseudonocardiaceae bacterium]
MNKELQIESVNLRALGESDLQLLCAFGNTMRNETSPGDPARPVELLKADLDSTPELVNFPAFWIRDEAGLAATAVASWLEVDTNKHLIHIDLNVRKDCRQRGFARELLSKCVEVSEAAGRPMITFSTNSNVVAGAKFTQAIGAEAKLESKTNHLVLTDVDMTMVDGWIAQAPQRSAGYTLVEIDGPYPLDLLDEIVDVNNVMNDAPRDDLDMEDWKWTREQTLE